MSKSPQRTLIYGGEVLTQNDERATHEALVLEGDTVLATGSLHEMTSLAGQSARRVDVEGACVMPGLIDSHPHFLHFAAFDAGCVKLYDARNHADILARIRTQAAITRPGEWIMTTPVGEPHYFFRRSWENLSEGRLPTRWELDAAAPDHPVWIQAYAPRTPNICAMNSKALQVLGFTRELPDHIDNVWCEKDEHGELTGIFGGSVNNYYNDSMFWLTRVVVQVMTPTDDYWYQGALEGQFVATSRGCTAAYEGHAMDASHIAAYQRVRDENQLSLRVLTSLEAGSFAFDLGLGLTEEIVRGNLALAQNLKQVTDPFFRVNGLTSSLGGPAWSGFLTSDRPYKDPYGRPTQGRSIVPTELRKEIVDFCLANDVRLNRLHTGIPEHRELLEWLAPYLDQSDLRSREWIIQHSLFIDDVSIKRFAEQNFHFTSSLSFCWGKGDMYAERLGEEALKELIPIGKMFDTGANVGLGSDWGPASPFEHMALAVTREFGVSGRRHDGPGYSINRQQALDGWTINNARLMQWEGIGALKPGYKADLAIVDRNPMTCSLEELPKTQVLRTVLGGKDVFDTNIFPRLDDSTLSAERIRPLERQHTAMWQLAGHVCGPQCTHSA